MSLKTILFLIAFSAGCGGALFYPVIGIIGYMMHYQIGPEGQWWAEEIQHWGIRYSYILALLTAISIAIHHRKLRYGDRLIITHEWLLVAFVAWAWLSTLIGLPAEIPDDLGDYAPLKLTKVLLFALMMSHVMTAPKEINLLLWVFVAGALFLGYQAYTAPDFMFRTGRLNAIGGPDFREANALAAYLAACLPIIGVQFMRAGWIGKLLCLVSGVLAVNGFVLARSRGGTVAIAGGAVVAILMAPKKYRKLILLGLVIAAIGGYRLTDPDFWKRSGTITAEESERDDSAQSRINIWHASVDMLRDYPLGVGAGNFVTTIGRYNPKCEGADAHSTFVRCYGELGIPGLALYLILVANSYRILWRTSKQARNLRKADGDTLIWACYAVAVSTTIVICGSFTNTHLYLEGPWWFFIIPVCIERALANAGPETAPMLAPVTMARPASVRG